MSHSVLALGLKGADQTLVMIDKDRQCWEVLDEIQKYLTRGVTHEEKSVLVDQQIDSAEQCEDAQKNTPTNQFVTAVNSHDKQTAGELATKLARAKVPITFSLISTTRSKPLNDSNQAESTTDTMK